MLENNFSREKIDTTLFIKRKDKKILVIQIYIDDIIFGSTNEDLCQEFAKLMQGEFEMSMMREFTFFLRLQNKQMKEGISIIQSKYIRELLKKFRMESSKIISTP